MLSDDPDRQILTTESPVSTVEKTAGEGNAVVESALLYATRGFAVLPVGRDKKPLTSHGVHDATKDSATITDWWRRWPDSGVAIAAGESGIIVIDIDPRHDGDKSLAALEKKLGPLPETPRVATGRGGTHYYFHADQEIRSRNNAIGPEFPGVDVKSSGGYVVVPPSVHESGLRYVWEIGHELDSLPLAKLPETWRNAVVGAKAGSFHPSGEIGKTNHIGRFLEGERNSSLTRIGGKMRRHGHSVDSVFQALRAVNRERCVPPLPETEVEGIARSLGRYEPGARKSGHAGAEPGRRPETTATFNSTDIGNAERLRERFGMDFRYCEIWQRFLVWDGKRWRPDVTGRLDQFAKRVARRIVDEAQRSQDEDKRAALLKHALKSEGDARIRAMIARVKSEVSILPDDLDDERTDWLLNVSNGVVDLHTGEIHPHDRSLFITKIVPIEYLPQADCPVWQRFLNRIMGGNERLIGYLQRAVGYSLLGTIRDRVILVVWGVGRNGKSVFLTVLREVLGDYGATTPTATFLERGNDGIPNDLARLKGVRFVSASECEAGSRLAPALIKRVTGGDAISARFLHAEWFEFRPHFKVWLATNHKPVIPDGGDQALWDRLQLIPFSVRIPEDEVIPTDRMLATLREELPGILKWAVKGCLDYQELGLDPPPEVVAATAEYRDEQDILSDFIEECCVAEPAAECTKADLYGRYAAWCSERQLRAINLRRFGNRIGSRPGIESGKTGGARIWTGIKHRGEREDKVDKLC